MTATAFETIRPGETPNLLWLHVHTGERLIGPGKTLFRPARRGGCINGPPQYRPPADPG